MSPHKLHTKGVSPVVIDGDGMLQVLHLVMPTTEVEKVKYKIFAGENFLHFCHLLSLMGEILSLRWPLPHGWKFNTSAMQRYVAGLGKIFVQQKFQLYGTCNSAHVLIYLGTKIVSPAFCITRIGLQALLVLGYLSLSFKSALVTSNGRLPRRLQRCSSSPGG